MSTTDAPDEVTPETLEDLSDEEIAAYNQEVESKLEERLDEHVQELSESQQEALDLLSPEDGETTTSVEIGAEAEVDVKTHMAGWVEDTLEEIFEDSESSRTFRRRIPEVMEWVIVDEDYADAALWRAYAEQYGSKELTLRFLEAIEPMAEDAENSGVVQRFRDRERRTD